MILTLILMSGSAGITTGAHYLYHKFKRKKKKKYITPEDTFQFNIPFPDTAYEELARTLKEEVVGYWFADALLEQVIKQGYRLTCVQIYSLQKPYAKKWPTMKDVNKHINDIAKYERVLKIEAEEKISRLVDGTDQRLVMQSKEVKQMLLEK